MIAVRSRNSLREVFRLVDRFDQVNMAARTSHHVWLGRCCRQKPGQRSKFTRHVRCRASANEDSAKLMTLPEFGVHVTVNPGSLKLYGETLLSCDLFSDVAQGTYEKMLEYGLKWKQDYLEQELLKFEIEPSNGHLILFALRPSRNHKLSLDDWCRPPSWTRSSLGQTGLQSSLLNRLPGKVES